MFTFKSVVSCILGLFSSLVISYSLRFLRIQCIREKLTPSVYSHGSSLVLTSIRFFSDFVRYREIWGVCDLMSLLIPKQKCPLQVFSIMSPELSLNNSDSSKSSQTIVMFSGDVVSQGSSYMSVIVAQAAKRQTLVASSKNLTHTN